MKWSKVAGSITEENVFFDAKLKKLLILLFFSYFFSFHKQVCFGDYFFDHHYSLHFNSYDCAHIHSFWCKIKAFTPHRNSSVDIKAWLLVLRERRVWLKFTVSARQAIVLSEEEVLKIRASKLPGNNPLPSFFPIPPFPMILCCIGAFSTKSSLGYFQGFISESTGDENASTEKCFTFLPFFSFLFKVNFTLVYKKTNLNRLWLRLNQYMCNN